MTIQYPVRVSLTDETLVVDRDNVEVATTFFGQEDYDAEYERRALDAAVIAECLNKRKALNELEEASIVAGEAYQIIGDLALAANLYDHPEVQRALNWFSGFEPGVTYKDDASILPWPKEELKADDGWFPIESAPRDGTPIMLAGGTWIGEINQPNPNEGIIIAIFKYNQWHCEACDAYASWVENPTHWMPLPLPPSSKDNESAI